MILTEKHVQAIWYDAAFRPHTLRGTNGEKVKVIDPGIWNLEAGPDFLGAVLDVEGTRLTGDVEIHLHPADFHAHGHDGDPAYAKLAAHVTWFPGDAHLGCLSICLGDAMREDPTFSPEAIDLSAYPYARLPSKPRLCTSLTDPIKLIRDYGIRRLRMKADRLRLLLTRQKDSPQLFYEEVFGALGYKNNAEVFRQLARIVPWRILPSNTAGATTALLLAAQMHLLEWHRAGCRPTNTPEKRIALAAELFARGLCLKQVFDSCDLTTKKDIKRAMDTFRAVGLGAHRAAAILANVLVPFALAEKRLERVPDYLPSEDINTIVRLMAFRLLGRDHNPALYARNGLLIQGLIQIYREFCRFTHPECEQCRLAAGF